MAESVKVGGATGGDGVQMQHARHAWHRIRHDRVPLTSRQGKRGIVTEAVPRPMTLTMTMTMTPDRLPVRDGQNSVSFEDLNSRGRGDEATGC